MSFYKFAPGISPNTFIFPTDLGWFYIVSFLNNAHTFKGNKILENKGLSYEISSTHHSDYSCQTVRPARGIGSVLLYL